ncbi:MAG TPA: ribbon-helix-helix protein, CopG family [Candidatus Thermoplasmatota archaeon]|nr:ribbon-helix-helix protein, CopG family [Candidatus Thermoplasmatota archaeon]
MPASKLSISLAPEVDQALDVLVARSGQAKSALIEVALRENPLVAKYIQIVRAEMHAEPASVPRREVREKAKERRTVQRVSP